MSNQKRVQRGVPTGGQFTAHKRDEPDIRLSGVPHRDPDNLNRTASRPPERRVDPERNRLATAVADARGAANEADRAVRKASTAARGSFEFPPLKALARRRERKARQHANDAHTRLSHAESALMTWDDANSNARYHYGNTER